MIQKLLGWSTKNETSNEKKEIGENNSLKFQKYFFHSTYGCISVSGGASGSGVSSVIGDSWGEGPMLAEIVYANIFYFKGYLNKIMT